MEKRVDYGKAHCSRCTMVTEHVQYTVLYNDKLVTIETVCLSCGFLLHLQNSTGKDGEYVLTAYGYKNLKEMQT